MRAGPKSKKDLGKASAFSDAKIHAQSTNSAHPTFYIPEFQIPK